jgi:hypothetical protein
MPETTVTNAISVSPSAGIEEIFSATFGYEFSESQSSSNTDSIDIPGGSSGDVTWTPIYECFPERSLAAQTVIPQTAPPQ